MPLIFISPTDPANCRLKIHTNVAVIKQIVYIDVSRITAEHRSCCPSVKHDIHRKIIVAYLSVCNVGDGVSVKIVLAVFLGNAVELIDCY